MSQTRGSADVPVPRWLGLAGAGSALSARARMGLRRTGTSARLVRPHRIRIQTPSGRIHDATAPPILGEGWAPSEPEREDSLDDELEEFEKRYTEWAEHAHEGHYWAA